MKKSIMTELKTWLYSGRILLVLASVIFVFAFGVYASYRTFMITNRSLLLVESTAAEMGMHDKFIENFTENGAKWEPNGDRLIQELKSAESHLHAINPKHALSYCMEMGYFFFPLLLTVIGALVVKSDMSHGIMRSRISREGRINYLWSKQTVLWGMCMGCVILGVLADYCITFLLYKYISNPKTFSMFDMTGNSYANLGNRFTQIVFFAFYILLFLELGFCLALITKSILIPTGVALVAFYVMPVYRYTPQNALANIITKMCDFQGIVHYSCTDISQSAVIWIITLLLIIPFSIAMIIYRFRSAYL